MKLNNMPVKNKVGLLSIFSASYQCELHAGVSSMATIIGSYITLISYCLAFLFHQYLEHEVESFLPSPKFKFLSSISIEGMRTVFLIYFFFIKKF